jgi:4-hydroxyphenylpyruvate dioxygenase
MPSSHEAARLPRSAPPPRLRRSIATVSLSGTLEEKLAAAARARFDGVELFENDLISCRLRPPEIRSLAADLGLDIMLYQPFRDFEAVPGEQLAASLRRAERKFAVMASLGATTLLVCSNTSPAAIGDDALAADQLRQLAGRACGHGIRIAFEALAWGRHISSYDHAWQVVSAADHPNLGLCLDSFHALSLGHDSRPIRDLPGGKIFFLQLADAPTLPMAPLPWSRHHRCFPGQGSFDLAGFVADVIASGYCGPWSLEVFNDVFRQGDAERTARDGMRSLLTLEDSLARSADTPGAAARENPVLLSGVPPLTGLSGYAFVELAVDALLEQAVARVLSGLGFVLSGRHRTKPVDMWAQAGARVLVNRSASDDRGRSGGGAAVAAIGVDSSDPLRCAMRASALLAPPVPRRRAADEADLAAIAAPDGTLVFCCQTDAARTASWLGDFPPLPPPQRARSPQITAVDHIALAQPFDGFDEATLFYRSLFGLQPQGIEEVASPYGLVRSRAMRSCGGAVRLVLNVPPPGWSRPPGGAPQHVAFACRDIFAAARAAVARGTPMLPVPDNYYDDLAARFDLDPHLLGRLRAHGVLYDRDEGGGEFLHFYTATIGQRLSFEVTQRNGGYDGYGVPATHVRMAAQLRYTAPGGGYIG